MEAKVRAALEEQEGIKRLLLGGLRTTVVMEEGKALDDAAVRKAVEAAQLTFVSLESVERPRPKAVYRIESEGLG